MKPAEAYIFSQPALYQNILLHLHSLIQQQLPQSELLFKWGIPYVYYKKKPFCYLAPNHKKGFVDLGFAKGFQLQRNQSDLVGAHRNTVKSLRYFSLEAIDHAILVDVIEEAAG
ncbi:MAG: DUF1801 domain-containing protein [Flavobacterium sp.]